MKYEFDSRVRYSEVDSRGRLTWLALMDYFQDCSVFQSEMLHLGVDYLAEHHQAWVLTSWQICLNQMPKLADKVTLLLQQNSHPQRYPIRNPFQSIPVRVRQRYVP